MKILVKFLLILNFSMIEIANLRPRLSYDTKILPKYIINLDLTVKERYKDILIEYKEKVKTYSYITSLMPFPYLVSNLGQYLLNKKTQDKEWSEFIMAVSEYCEIPINQAVMISVTYDLACTSTIINDNKDNIIMGRNLDFSTYFVIAHLMIEVEYFKNKKSIYKGIELVGFRGAINAVKPGKFATSINLRWSNDSKLGNLYRIFQGFPTPNFYLMKVMESADNFEEAVHMLSKQNLSASVFYSISGVNKNQGVIISRDHDKLHSMDRLDVMNGKWFLVVTNTDLDKNEPLDDYRRIPTEENLKKIGRDNINYSILFDKVMGIYPTNNLITVYTTIQSAISDGYFNTTLWIP